MLEVDAAHFRPDPASILTFDRSQGRGTSDRLGSLPPYIGTHPDDS
jgi:hypothetical protein